MASLKNYVRIAALCSPLVTSQALAACIADGSHNAGWRYQLVDGRPCWHPPHRPAVIGALVPVHIHPHQWSGFYGGPVLGYGWSTTLVGVGATQRIAGVDMPQIMAGSSSIIIGGEIGYRHQLKDTPWVLGLSNQFVSFNSKKVELPATINKLKYLNTTDGWIGHVFNPKLTGWIGFGPAEENYQTNRLDTGQTTTTTMTGFDGAVRLEIALNRDWNISGQYLFANFGKGRDVQAVTWGLLYRPPVGEAAAMVP